MGTEVGTMSLEERAAEIAARFATPGTPGYEARLKEVMDLLRPQSRKGNRGWVTPKEYRQRSVHKQAYDA